MTKTRETGVKMETSVLILEMFWTQCGQDILTY